MKEMKANIDPAEANKLSDSDLEEYVVWLNDNADYARLNQVRESLGEKEAGKVDDIIRGIKPSQGVLAVVQNEVQRQIEEQGLVPSDQRTEPQQKKSA